ncbi:MAG: serine/threonine-protein phosphatase [Desulfobacteraceae bacterium]|nr:MAG: serine/threonine-protein phosphatase [Desulfobacteraceae bacterium]
MMVPMSYSLVYSARSEIGHHRKNNEDTLRVNLERGFCLVADGIGGGAAGEVASRLFAETADEIFQNASDRSEAEALARVQETFRCANSRVREHAAKHPLHLGLGCTADLMAFHDHGFVLGHLGDSRSYRMRNHHLMQLTKDHSLVQHQLDAGLISPDDARTHPMRHVILRAVGGEDEVSLDLIRGPIHSKDLYLLCSDGLTDFVDDDRLAAILNMDQALAQKVDALIDAALTAGGYDNITAALVQAE